MGFVAAGQIAETAAAARRLNAAGGALPLCPCISGAKSVLLVRRMCCTRSLTNFSMLEHLHAQRTVCIHASAAGVDQTKTSSMLPAAQHSKTFGCCFRHEPPSYSRPASSLIKCQRIKLRYKQFPQTDKGLQTLCTHQQLKGGLSNGHAYRHE